MVHFYLDNDVPTSLVNELFALGYVSTHSRSRNAKRASDPAQLLTAAQNGWLYVTHSKDDYYLLHTAWRLWGQAYGAPPPHPGILRLPQLQGIDYAAALHDFVSNHPQPLSNELYEYDPRYGWRLWTPPS